jgi:hypothetical protein
LLRPLDGVIDFGEISSYGWNTHVICYGTSWVCHFVAINVVGYKWNVTLNWYRLPGIDNIVTGSML